MSKPTETMYAANHNRKRHIREKHTPAAGTYGSCEQCDPIWPICTRCFTEHVGMVCDEVPDKTLEFLAYHRANPGVFRELTRMAQFAKQAGRTKGGVNALIEGLRWEPVFGRPWDKEKREGGEFAIRNDWAPYYARLLWHTHTPHLDDFFDMNPGEPDLSLYDWLEAAK